MDIWPLFPSGDPFTLAVDFSLRSPMLSDAMTTLPTYISMKPSLLCCGVNAQLVQEGLKAFVFNLATLVTRKAWWGTVFIRDDLTMQQAVLGYMVSVE